MWSPLQCVSKMHKDLGLEIRGLLFIKREEMYKTRYAVALKYKAIVT